MKRHIFSCFILACSLLFVIPSSLAASSPPTSRHNIMVKTLNDEFGTASIKVNGASCELDQQISVESGDDIQISFAPAKNYIFLSWRLRVDDGINTSTTIKSLNYSFKMPENDLIISAFCLKENATPSIYIHKFPYGDAEMIINDKVYSVGESATVLPGTPITITTRADKGYRFKGWFITIDAIPDADLNSATLKFAMPRYDLVVTPYFEKSDNVAISNSSVLFSNYWITAKAHEGGTITDAGQKRFDAGEDHTYTILPDEGYQIDRVLVDDLPVALSGNTYTFKNISEPYTIEAYFVKSEAEAQSENEAVVNPPTGDVWWKWML